MIPRTAFLATLILACAALAEEPKKEDVAKNLLGTWQLTKGVVAGNPFPEEVVKKLKLELTDGKYKLLGAESPDEGTWTIDVGKKPFEMDIKGTDGPNKGKTYLCIFELKGDKLKVCYDLSGKARPTEFESKSKTLHFLAEYDRVKKE
ncbi:MAG TPA: TIGR03067 domain-containing protein [Planctomycetia bacterium]|nr:TIGR03067 domain-containing protein [Planctomycetia bacterium]